MEERLLNINSNLALVKIMDLKNMDKMRNIGKMLWKIKLLWTNEVEEWGKMNA